MEFMQTLLPLPVAPAIIMWGSPARSRATESPPASAPRAMGSPPLAAIFLNSGRFHHFPHRNLAGREGVGTSSPSSASPGTGSKRRFGAADRQGQVLLPGQDAVDSNPAAFTGRAVSVLAGRPLLESSREAGQIARCEVPALISATSTLTPWSANAFSISWAICFSGFSSVERISAGPSRSMEGSRHLEGLD